MGIVTVNDNKYKAEFVLDNAGDFEVEYKTIKFKSLRGTGTVNILYDKKDSQINLIFQDRDTSFIINNIHVFARKELKF